MPTEVDEIVPRSGWNISAPFGSEMRLHAVLRKPMASRTVARGPAPNMRNETNRKTFGDPRAWLKCAPFVKQPEAKARRKAFDQIQTGLVSK